MAESLESFKSYIGKSETATDVVTASAMVKFAATLGLANPPLEKGSPIPPGWYGGFFPASQSSPLFALRPGFHSQKRFAEGTPPCTAFDSDCVVETCPRSTRPLTADG